MNFVKKLGEGGYGKVDLYEMKGEFVVVKTIETVNSVAKDNADREIKILKLLKRGCEPFFNCLISYKVTADSAEIITKYIPNTYELYDFLENNKLPSEYVLYVMIENLANGLRILHDRYKVVHKDIKPENILFNPDRLSINYIDFGTACFVDDIECIEDFGGTFDHLSPELMQYIFAGKDPPLTFEKWKASDIWALGITIIFIATEGVLKNFFHIYGLQKRDFADALAHKTTQKDIDKSLKDLSETSPTNRLLCEIAWPMLQYDWKTRITASELYNRMIKQIPNIMITRNLPVGQKLHDINSKAAKDITNFVVNPKTKYMGERKRNKSLF